MPADRSVLRLDAGVTSGPGGAVTRPTRRGALLASVAAVGLVTAACGEASPPGVSNTEAATSEGGDDAVLAAVRTELATAHALVAATLERHRTLRGPLGELQATRAAQLVVLDPDGEVGTPEPPPVARDAAAALARVRGSEERLQRRLLTWAVAVDSGPLARVLAAAAAGTAQHLAVLPGGELT